MVFSAIGNNDKNLYNSLSMNNLPADNKVKIDDDQNVVSGLTVAKERVESGSQEITPMTEFTRKVDLEPEVESWLEKLEKEDSQLQQPIVDPGASNGDDKVVLNNIEPSEFKVILPLTKDEVEIGLHHKVMDSIRWLAEWCIKTIKMFHGKVAYRKGR